jgi:hypothetical protein
MNYLIFFIIILFLKIPLSAFQFLLLICLVEVKSGILIGDYYYSFILFGYLFARWSWYKAIHPRSSVWN